jgi:hypothetical protein
LFGIFGGIGQYETQKSGESSMAASSNLTDRFITVWYGLIWLVLFAAVVYEFAQENALASAPP